MAVVKMQIACAPCGSWFTCMFLSTRQPPSTQSAVKALERVKQHICSLADWEDREVFLNSQRLSLMRIESDLLA